MPLSSIVKIWTFVAPFLRNFVKIAFSLEWISTLFQSDWNESEAQKNSTEGNQITYKKCDANFVFDVKLQFQIQKALIAYQVHDLLFLLSERSGCTC